MNYTQVYPNKHHDDETVATEASTVLVSPCKPRVQFSETIHIQKMPGLDDYTNEEFAACWWTPKEFAKIEKRAMKECAKMERGKVLKDKKYCSRGLEKYRTFNYHVSTDNIHLAIKSVLTEQDWQITNQEFDDEAIAQVYRNVSSSCEMWARVIGLRDQKDAESYMDDDDEKGIVRSKTSTMPSTVVRKEKIPISKTLGPMPVLQRAVSARSA